MTGRPTRRPTESSQRTKKSVLISARSIVLGWATLLALTYLLERPVLTWTAPLLGAHWFQTALLGLDCLSFAATGWVIGHFNRSGPILGVLVFAATLTFWDLGQFNVPWLLRLTAHALGDSHYLDSLFATAASHAFLVGSLIAGGLLSRPSQPLPRITADGGVWSGPDA